MREHDVEIRLTDERLGAFEVSADEARADQRFVRIGKRHLAFRRKRVPIQTKPLGGLLEFRVTHVRLAERAEMRDIDARKRFGEVATDDETEHRIPNVLQPVLRGERVKFLL